MELIKIQIILDNSGHIINEYLKLPKIDQYATNYLIEVAPKYDLGLVKYKLTFNILGKQTPKRVLAPTFRKITLDDSSETSNVWEYQLTQYETQFYQDELTLTLIVEGEDGKTISTNDVSLDMVRHGFSKITPANLDEDSSVNSLSESVYNIGYLVNELKDEGLIALIDLNLENGEGLRSIQQKAPAGSLNIAKGEYDAVFGRENNNQAACSLLAGCGLHNTTDYKSIVGKYNDNKGDTLFEVGNGEDSKHPSNAFEVLLDGRAKVYKAPEEENDVVRKKELTEALVGKTDYLGTVSAITELSTSAGKGDFYRVSTSFTFGDDTAHVGDILLSTKDNPSQSETDWDLIHTDCTPGTWLANTKTAAGYVAKGESNPNKVWATDAEGNPAWRDEINSNLENGAGAGSLEQKGTVTVSGYSGNIKAQAQGPASIALNGLYTPRKGLTPESDGVIANGPGSFAGGKDTTAYQACSFAFGGGNKAGLTEAEFNTKYPSGKDGHDKTYAESYSFATAEGVTTKATGYAAHAENESTEATGPRSHASGQETHAKGNRSFATGYKTNATDQNSFAMGEQTNATGINSLAGGFNSTSSNYCSIAFGENCTASNMDAIATGYFTQANGKYSLAAGRACLAGGEATVAVGRSNKTTVDYQFVCGKYCEENTPDALFVVGNGEDVDNRGNAFMVMEDGRAKVYKGPESPNDVATKAYVDSATKYLHNIKLSGIHYNIRIQLLDAKSTALTFDEIKTKLNNTDLQATGSVAISEKFYNVISLLVSDGTTYITYYNGTDTGPGIVQIEAGTVTDKIM